MPMPYAYRDASKEFRAFLLDAKERLHLPSDNTTYTVTDAVFQVFRRRLTVQQGLIFADALPAVLRAIFVSKWDSSQDPLPFADRKSLTAEVQSIRKHHIFAPNNAIDGIAWALNRHVMPFDFNLAMSKMPVGSQAFWAVSGDPAPL